VTLSKRAELALFAYVNSSDHDVTFETNFRESFKRLTGHVVSNLDLTLFNRSSLQLPRPDSRYGYVTIDGVKTPLLAFTTPVTTVFKVGPDAGKIRPGIARSDIVINSSQPVSGFSTVFIPGSSWASKWRDPLLGHVHYIFINFKHLEDIENENEQSESEQSIASSRSSSQISQYGEEESDYENPTEITVTKLPQWTTVDLDVPDFDDQTTRRDFDSLSARERYLPLSHVISPADEWRAIFIALQSNFTRTDGLPKVSDRSLSDAADAIAYSIQIGNVVPNAAYSVLRYASYRNV